MSSHSVVVGRRAHTATHSPLGIGSGGTTAAYLHHCVDKPRFAAFQFPPRIGKWGLVEGGAGQGAVAKNFSRDRLEEGASNCYGIELTSGRRPVSRSGVVL